MIMRFIQKPVKGDLFIYTMNKQWLPEILEIESESSENFWGRSDFVQLMKNPFIKGYVAVKLRTVTSFVMYEKKENHYNILNLGFRKSFDCSLLLERMKKLLNPKRSYLAFDVRETSLPTHLFLKDNGFIATKVIPRYFQDYWSETEVEDAYNFKFCLTN